MPWLAMRRSGGQQQTAGAGPAAASQLLAAAAAIVLLMLLASSPAAARVQKLDRDERFELSPDEGLLLIAVDTSTDLRMLRIRRDGTLFDGGSLSGLSKGQNAQLYVVPAGRYRFDQLRATDKHFRLGDDEEFAFDVRPGVLNYPGHLIYRSRGAFDSMVHVSNRGLLALDWLETSGNSAARALAFEYTGHYPDPFPALYAAERAKHASIVERNPPVPAAGPLPISIEALWRRPDVERFRLNRSGDLLAIASREVRGTQTLWSIDMVDLIGNASVRVLESPHPIDGIEWSGARVLLLSVGASDAPQVVFVLRARDGKGGRREYDRLHVPRSGMLVDALPNDPDHILFASLFANYSDAGIHVHKLDISSQKALDQFGFSHSRALDEGVKRDWAWYADGLGRLRAALASVDETSVLMHGIDGEFREVLRFDEIDRFLPMALSADGESFIGTSDTGREQRDLVDFDPATGEIGKTLFSRAGVDVQGPLFDADRKLIGATTFDGGQRISHYFDDDGAAIYRKLLAAFPGKSVDIVDRDAAAKQFIVLVGGSDQPGAIYHFDADARRASLIQQTMPWLADARFAPTRVVKARSADGLEIESYLTLPTVEGKSRLPLVLFPHGGPIGVRDSRYFDPEVQFLASLGYAVLQVNFRGSEGYGKSFRDAGRGSYGTLIEDDIDAALAAALAAHPLDPDRMCVMGSSYGGYSALVSSIRWPGRFRCAISISGVSDRLLFFTASDGGRSSKSRALMEEAIGDPRRESESMRSNSPLYRIDRLTLPVMLIHGDEDYRVDFEHTRRLSRMLHFAGRPPLLLRMEGDGHGDWSEANRKRLWEGVAGFLRTHLAEPTRASAATP